MKSVFLDKAVIQHQICREHCDQLQIPQLKKALYTISRWCLVTDDNKEIAFGYNVFRETTQTEKKDTGKRLVTLYKTKKTKRVNLLQNSSDYPQELIDKITTDLESMYKDHLEEEQ